MEIFLQSLRDIFQEQPKAQCAKSLTPHEIPVSPWQIVATDLFQVNGSQYMLVVDYYVKWKKFKEFSSLGIINLTKQIFGEQGILEWEFSDNGPHCSSNLFKRFAKEWDLSSILKIPPVKWPKSCNQEVTVNWTWCCYAYDPLP